MGCVYLITNTVNSKQYVGKTIGSFSDRWSKHRRDTAKGSSSLLHRALRRYGFDAFKWERLYRSNDNEKLIEREIFYIKLLVTKTPNGYNLTDGGDGMVGFHHSVDTRNMIRVANTGKCFSYEHRAKIGIASSNRSDDVLARIAAGQMGRKHAV